ncbi:MAG TPA: transposase [Chthoniobacterales bacterium]
MRFAVDISIKLGSMEPRRLRSFVAVAEELAFRRSLLVESSGVPVGLAVAGANKIDFKLFVETLRSIPVERPAPSSAQPQHLGLDKGYDFEEVRWRAAAFGLVGHIRTRGEEAPAPEAKLDQKARRWVVERTHSWINRFRSLLIRLAEKTENYLGLLHFVCGLIA